MGLRLVAVGAIAICAAGCSSSSGPDGAPDGSSGSADRSSSGSRATGATTSGASRAATSSGAAGPKDPCALITRSEAQRMIDTKIANVRKDPVGPFSTCGYYGSYRAGLTIVQVQVSSVSYTKESFESAARGAQSAGVGDIKPVSGIGDAAYEYSGPSGAGGYVQALKGNTFFQILVTGSSNDVGNAESLAKKVAARL